jgi:hypothetical protein
MLVVLPADERGIREQQLRQQQSPFSTNTADTAILLGIIDILMSSKKSDAQYIKIM